MDQIACTIKRVLTFSREQKYKYNEGCIRMSDLNQTTINTTCSTNNTEITNRSIAMSKEESFYYNNNNDPNLIDESNIKSALEILYMTANRENSETVESNFEEKTNSSLSQISNLNDSDDNFPIPFKIRRENNKHIIVINSFPNKDNNNVNVLKLKITIPSKNNLKCITNEEENNHISILPPEKSETQIKPIKNIAPTMGKNALLSKMNKNSEDPKSDSEIVQELVTERFGHILDDFHQKTLQRQTSRVFKNSVDNSEINDSIFDNCQIAHSTLNENLAQTHESAYNQQASSSKSSAESGNYHAYNTSAESSDETISALNSLESLANYGDLNFLLSTDENNVETTDDHVKTHSTNFESHDDSDRLSYDANKFLEAALGEEWRNYISTALSEVEDDENHSIGTSNISALISKASSYLSVQPEDILSKSTITYDEEGYYQDTISEAIPFSKKLSDLILESNRQNQIMIQTTKALNVCKNTKEFVSSIEEVEAERILLLATLKREALREEIQRLEYEEIEHDLSSNFGTIKITGVTVPLKHLSALISNVMEKRKSKEFSNWFIFVISTGATVLASKPVRCNGDGLVKFEETFLITDLPSDFQINISIYSMRIRNNLRNYSHESKFHLNKNVKTLCPSPQKLFQITRDLKVFKHNPEETSVIPSSFNLDGKCVLRINNLRELGFFKLFEMPSSSLLEGSIIVHFASQVNINEIHEDFLNIGTESVHLRGVTWNRRWCSLKAHQLFIYNYPGQEEPLGFIDLTYCVSASVNPVDRSMCPRSKTLLLETLTSDNNRECIHSFERLIIRYFLTADTAPSMKTWQNKLNNTISALRNWNFMNC